MTEPCERFVLHGRKRRHPPRLKAHRALLLSILRILRNLLDIQDERLARICPFVTCRGLVSVCVLSDTHRERRLQLPIAVMSCRRLDWCRTALSATTWTALPIELPNERTQRYCLGFAPDGSNPPTSCRPSTATCARKLAPAMSTFNLISSLRTL